MLAFKEMVHEIIHLIRFASFPLIEVFKKFIVLTKKKKAEKIIHQKSYWELRKRHKISKIESENWK